MLKYQINKANMRSNLKPIDGEFIVRDLNFTDEIILDDQFTVICYHDESVGVKEGDIVVAIRGTGGTSDYVYAPSREYRVEYVDENRHCFNFSVGKYFQLQPDVIQYPNDNWLYFDLKFKNPHYFPIGDPSIKTIYVKGYNAENGEYELKPYSGEPIDEYTLRFYRSIDENAAPSKYDVNDDRVVDNEDIMTIIKAIINNEPYNPKFDVNDDNTVSVGDINTILGYINDRTGDEYITYVNKYDKTDVQVVSNEDRPVNPDDYEFAFVNTNDNNDLIGITEYSELSFYGKDSLYIYYGDVEPESVTNGIARFWISGGQYKRLPLEYKEYWTQASYCSESGEYCALTQEEYEKLSDQDKRKYVECDDPTYINVVNFMFYGYDFKYPPYFIFNPNPNAQSFQTGLLTDLGQIDYRPLSLKPVEQDDICALFEYLTNNATLFDVSGKVIYRQDIMFASDYYATGMIATQLYKKTNLAKLPIPLSAKFSDDTFFDEAIRKDFVEREMAKAINPIVDMEKNIYYPTLCAKNDKDEDVFIDTRTIKINLHFRYRDSDWNTIANEQGEISFWNGVWPRVASLGQDLKVDKNYFSYKNTSLQSDLLTELGFGNADVKYRKNILSKSFLRLSFYDSPDIFTQNLLYYATVFLNSGELSSKYMRFFKDGNRNYKTITVNDDGFDTIPKSGIRVDTEPYTTKNKLLGDDVVEDYRLSSQFVIRDKYSSDNSSDGFYVYLWKTDDMGIDPLDIYMKVEFNHAGYGRTIPFMLPFNINSKKIKKFEDIVKDWSSPNGNGYNLNDYLKYSHIHLKCQQNKDRNRHIYYLDPDDYGHQDANADCLTLNLYEAMITSFKPDQQ